MAVEPCLDVEKLLPVAPNAFSNLTAILAESDELLFQKV
jgi:hypothetical protein